MARTRTTPATSPQITQDTIDYFIVQIGRDSAGVANPALTTLKYMVSNRLADGTPVVKTEESQTISEWSGALQTGIEAAFDAVLVDAENQGLIGAGTDSDDLV